MKSEYLRRLDTQGHLFVNRKLHEWDPIGCGVPEDEYDSYAGQMIQMLDRSAPKEKMMEYLKEIAEQYIGVSNPTERASRIIDELVEWWPKWKADIKQYGPLHQVDENYPEQASVGNADKPRA